MNQSGRNVLMIGLVGGALVEAKMIQKCDPLFLPYGSVRAILTFLIISVVISEMVNGRELEVFWSEVLMIALAHYFTLRKFIDLPQEVLEKLEEEGHITKESHPLFLPPHSVQVLIIGSFVGVSCYLYKVDKLFLPHALSVLAMVGVYFAGVIVRIGMNYARGAKKQKVCSNWLDHLKALSVVVVMAITAWFYVYYGEQSVPHSLRNAAVGLVLFYFGSR